ncbi:MAG: hypothetical protein V3W44_08415 [Dehalococcoidales bacterium]
MSEPKHTKEPWGNPGLNYGYMNEADGNRAVVCVNALAGIPTEALEAGAIKGLVDALEDLVYQVRQLKGEETKAIYYDDADKALAALKPVPPEEGG